jgi:hypothetical protein
MLSAYMSWLVVLAAQPVFALIALRPGVPRSRRLLAAALALTVPVVGPLLALVARRLVGQVDPEEDPAQARPASGVSAAEARRLGQLPPVLDQLMSADSEERLTAMVRLSSQGDPASVALLRWMVERGSPEVVLDAALALEEIGLRCEERFEKARQEASEGPSYERAILLGIADGTGAAMLADQARSYYEMAYSLDPERRAEVAGRWAKLELAAARPAAAVDLLDAVSEIDVGAAAALEGLRGQALFAARRFHQLH